ncbi:Cyclin-D4-1 protein [Spatholobus suberectus]|nr:Cyclin-D4-1 protein [Spatholobus suberectus]
MTLVCPQCLQQCCLCCLRHRHPLPKSRFVLLEVGKEKSQLLENQSSCLKLTPFSFIDYFLGRITCKQHPVKSSISRSVQLILNIIRGIDFLEFQSSKIVVRVAISILRESQAKEIDKAITDFLIVEKGRVIKCVGDTDSLDVVGEEDEDHAWPFLALL